MPSFSIADASARTPRPDAFSERKSSSMMTIGKRNFIGYLRAAARRKRRWVLGKARIIRARSRRESGIFGAGRRAVGGACGSVELTFSERSPRVSYPRDLRGYGADVPHAGWPGHARIDIIKRMTGAAPLGWYTGRDSPNTRRLVVEHGGFLYDADYYGDDLPLWTDVETVGGAKVPHLIVPYSLDCNDMRFATPHGFSTGRQFLGYLQDAFDALYAEGAERPKMMSIGMHGRLLGRPGRFVALQRFLDYVERHDRVWVCRRGDVARHWAAHHPRRAPA